MEVEIGSDAQMSIEQMAEVQRRYELALAEALEEDRKTAAQPIEDDPAS